MTLVASTSRSPAPVRVDDTLRLPLGDGALTTVHVARWPLARTRARVVALGSRRRVHEWCTAEGRGDALVGGFYTRPAGRPLGEVRIAGRPVGHVPFTAPWHESRASLHVNGDVLTIDRRDALPACPPGDLLQAGPLLVRDGAVVRVEGRDDEGFSAAAHQFDSDITSERHPRCALGVGNGEVIAVACDGRAEDDAGLLLGELATLMAELGATSALNLDGGGSASLVCDGRLRNRPREQRGVDLVGGRSVATLIAFEPA